MIHAVLLVALSLIPLSAAPFTPGNLVIYRVGDGTGSLANTGNPVFLDEYTPSGSFVQSIPMPTTPSFFGRRLVANGTATSEGQLTRSADSRFLVATGYDASIPYFSSLSGTASNSVFRTIGRVDSASNVDTSTFLQDFANGGTPRSATSLDGSSFWMAGSTGGVRYAPFGSTNSSSQLNASNNSLRQVSIFDGQLFVSSGGTQTAQITSVGVGLPTTNGQTLDTLPGLPASGVAYGFFLADLNRDILGNDTLYVADDTVGLTKYSLVDGAWTSNGTIGTNADDYRGLTANVVGHRVRLFSIRQAQAAAGGGEFVELTDDSGYNGTFTGVPTLRATAGANTAFRGIAPAPFVGPDLVIELSAPESGVTGTPFDYVLTVRNIGNEAVGSFSSEFSFSGDLDVQSFNSSEGSADIQEEPFANQAILALPSGLAAGASVTLTITVVATAPATYSLSRESASVDFFDQVTEVNESNNLLSHDIVTIIAGGTSPIVLGQNAVFNGDAEAGPGSNSGSIQVAAPGWTATGTANVINYGVGDYPNPESPGPLDRGLNFFGGGLSTPTSLTQTIGLASIAGDVSSGLLGFDLSGYLGGFGNQSDRCSLTAEFLAANNDVISSTVIGPVTPSDRENVTGMLYRSTSGFVPPAASAIRVTLDFFRSAGTSNDGYADNIALVFLYPTPPSITSQPADQMVASGATATLDVTVVGDPVPTLQWYQGLTGDISTPIIGAIDSTFTTSPLTESSEFWVRATNLAGTVDSDTASLTVEGSPAPEILVINPITSFGYVSGEPVDFGSELVGVPTGVVNFRVSNAGDADLEILEILIIGPHADDFDVDLSGAPSSLAPSETFDIPVTYTPGAQGPRLAVLSIATNDGENTPFILNLTGTGTSPVVLGQNVIFNGDAETGSGGTGVILPAPGWTTIGNATVVNYGIGSFPLLDSPGPANRGVNFFAGGPSGSFSTMSQEVDLSNIMGQVATGLIGFELSGFLGGYRTQNDNSTLTAEFLAIDDSVIRSEVLGPVTDTERNNVTGLIFRSTSGAVPVNAHAIRLTQTFTRTSGTRSDGYSDNLSLVFFNPSPPIITSEPANQAIASGGTAELSVAASGAPTPTYQWYAGLSGDTSNPIPDANSSTFITPVLTASADYWVRATNSLGSANSATASVGIDLIVNGSFEQPVVGGSLLPVGSPNSATIPGWTVSQGNIEVITPAFWPGSEGVQSLDLSGFNAGTVFQDVGGLVPGATYRLSFDLSGNPNPSGNPIKSVEVSAGQISTVFDFDTTPYRTSGTATDVGWESRSLVLVSDDGTARIEFRSLNNSAYGPALDKVTLVRTDDPVVGVSSNARLSDLTVSNGILSPPFAPLADNYELNVPNSISSIALTPTLADPGATLEINGSPLPSGTESAPLAIDVGENIITIVVTAEDGITTRTYTINLTRFEPLVVITGPASSVTASRARLNGAVNPRGAIIAYFEYGTSPTYGSVTAGQTVSGSSLIPVSANLIGITGGTTYHYRIVVVGADGTISGNNETFTTGLELPVAATGSPVAVSDTGATLVGAVSSNGLPVDAHFEFGLTTLYGSSTPTQTFSAGTSLNDVLAPITGLLTSANYHCRIVATSAAGTTFGRDVSFVATQGTGTGTGIPTDPPDVITLGTAAIDTESAELLGSVNPNDGTTVVRYEFGTTTSYGRVSEVQGVGNGNEIAAVSIAAEGLLPGTLYHYRLTASNSLGISLGDNATFTTEFLTPAVTTGVATALSTTTAGIVGTVRARNADAQVFVDYGTNRSSLSNSVVATPASISGNSVTQVIAELPDLMQGTKYFYQVRAVNSGGTGLGAIRSFDVGVLSGLFQQFPDGITTADHQGSLTVNLTPEGIGSGWRFSGEREWLSAGSAATGLASGDRVIEYRPVPGYVQPTDETAVVISDGSPTLIDRAYVPTVQVGSGGLAITLKPESLADISVPVASRAQWRFFGETDLQWKDSGTTITSLVAGDYVIECKPVAGRTTPPAVSASVEDGTTTPATITYFITEDLVGSPPAILSFETVSTNEERPYAYVGQITSDVGASTGFVVRPRVVATAGHVVFDDGTLASTTGLQWLFQRDRGVHEPAPQVPRGYYLMAGYSAQRALDNSPGTSTPESQNLDAAALYFSEDAGRSGFSGFLASDSTVNEFVVSTALKTLVGYPIDGIAPEDQGRMHATPLSNVDFASAFGQTYTTSDIRSSGGNSGGPLCVQHVNGLYYPAAIYLGGTAQTVVRAIDGDVLDLFGFAQTSANVAAGESGGSITQSGTTPIGTPTLGAIKVNIEPASARAAGAGWRIQAQADYSTSGAQIDDLSPNDYTVQFAKVSGFVPPTSQTLMIQAGQLTTITFTYEEIISPPVINSPNTLTITRGQPLSYTITATNSPTLYTQQGTLPTGTSFNAESGIISGTGQEAGNFPVTIGASNSGGADTRVINLTVQPVFEAQSVTLPYQQAASYQILSSESGDGLSFGSAGLPTGLSLDNSTGLITGTPTVPGTFVVPISLTRGGATATSTLTFNITGTVPVITQQPPATKSVEYGLSTTLTVAASGLPEPTYQWYRGASGDISNLITGANTPTFTTPPITANTSFWVRASSNSGSADSTATAVEALLSSNPRLSSLTSQVGSLATTLGSLSPGFNPGIQNYSINVPYGLTGIILVPGVQVVQSTVEIGGNPVIPGTPSQVQPLEVGPNPIQVVVTAGDGVSTLTYTVVVTRAQPPVVTTGAATLVTDVTATLNGTVTPNGPVGIRFQYGVTTDYGSTTPLQSVTGPAERPVQVELVGLVGNTTYHYRMVAVTGAENIFGEDMTFTTNLARPLAATGSPAAVTTSQATLIGAVNPRGLAAEAYFEYGTSPAFGSVTPTQNLNPGSSVVDVIDIITGLTAGETYYYRIVASSAAGTSFGDTISFPAISSGGSGDGIVDALPTVTTGSASDIMIDSAVLQGVVNPNDGTTFVFFEYGETDSYGSSTASEGIGNGTEPANVTLGALGLNPGTTYHFRLIASNSLGTIAGADRTFTSVYFPPIATTGSATALSSTSATVTGTIQARGTSAEAWFDYGTDGVNFPNSIRAVPQTVIGDLEAEVSVDLTNLDGAQTYYYRVRAEGSGGTGIGDPLTLQVGALLGFEQEFTRKVPSGDFEGQVVVNLLPDGIGGWRFSGETQWRPSGVTVEGMTSGEREIEFQPVPDYIHPQQELVGVVSGENPVTLERIYYESNAPGTGVLRVLLEPEALAGPGVPEANRLQWRLANGNDPTWRNSDEELTGMLGGSYLIECKAVAGKSTPTPANHLVIAGETTTASITYAAAGAPLFNPPAIVPFSITSESEDQPYAYVGQVRSGTGSYSGFVVKPRVVATVAQAVFDDATLAATNGTQWLLQRDRGTYEPTPLVPRGFYVFTGYDAQRASEDTPGTLAIESQNLNVATLYFAADAGRGGYSGFLASDEENNEFLQSDSLKTLVGYPVNGIVAANQGRMHATSRSSASFTFAQGRTYTSPSIRGIGGMTGGPLCVQYQEGNYFPAGIYVGGSTVGAVRAIDSSFIDIITRAEISANGGDNNTGGGITHSSFASIGVPTQPGALQVTIEPAEARNVGGGWRLAPETSYRPSGNQKSGLNAGSYKLEFTTVAGFQAPTEQSVVLDGGQLLQVTFTYQTETNLTDLEQWRLDNFGTSENSGDAADGADPDHDGSTNIDENIAGTDPNDSTDVFKVLTTARSGSSFTVTAAGKAGRSYTLQRATSLAGPWPGIQTIGSLATDGTVTLEDAASPPGQAFYRIEVASP